jgi:putative Holliday junction resolvase
MARILAVDYGFKRTGLAWTDPLKIIATALETVPTPSLEEKLKSLMSKEKIEAIVLGFPTRLDGSDTDTTAAVRKLAKRLSGLFPEVKVEFQDEQFSSKMALNAMIQGGVPKMKRRDKSMVDKVSAVIILQDYLLRTQGSI